MESVNELVEYEADLELFGPDSTASLHILGMKWVDWIPYVIGAMFQVSYDRWN